jgi:hypothetical protein
VDKVQKQAVETDVNSQDINHLHQIFDAILASKPFSQKQKQQVQVWKVIHSIFPFKTQSLHQLESSTSQPDALILKHVKKLLAG